MSNPQFSERIIFVTFDQLSRSHGALATAVPGQDQIVFIESHDMLTARTWHAQRLFFLLSCCEHLKSELDAGGFQVTTIHASSMRSGLEKLRAQHPDLPIVSTSPSSRSLRQVLNSLGVELLPNNNFLTTPEQFTSWASGYKSLTMEYFYRWQRKRLNILMDHDQPVGGQWNLDHDNRLPPPRPKKGQAPHLWPEPLRFESDRIDDQVRDRLSEFHTWGEPPNGTWATTRTGALAQLAHFTENSLTNFGPFEDAMPTDTWTVNHSLLSPYLNVGLLHPGEVVQAAIDKYEQGGIPLSSVEGFVRQVIGWREYINGIYWHFPDSYREENALDTHGKLLPLFMDPQATQMNCMSSVIADVQERAWVHHIPRLMLLSNLAQLVGMKPQELLDWMRTHFIDAADWVMVPNVIGMGMHADGGAMMTKPYIAGGAYISRMSNYCGGCAFDPKKRTGEDACPFTTLYWDYLDRNRDYFAGNHRMSRPVAAAAQREDLEQIRDRASQVLAGLYAGKI
ncbi:MAG: deoxyribodipyrimidine photolyase [Actinobacteria bacterium]|nr:deoxyribodipyrimidine photolyase [Actinomycetota bacterium]